MGRLREEQPTHVNTFERRQHVMSRQRCRGDSSITGMLLIMSNHRLQCAAETGKAKGAKSPLRTAGGQQQVGLPGHRRGPGVMRSRLAG